MRRYLPLILVAFLAIFIVPQLFNRGKGSSSTLSEQDRGALTLDAAERIGRAEAKYLAQNGTYTSHLSDLVQRDEKLADRLTVPLTVEIDVGSDGKSYLVRVSSDVLSVARSSVNGKAALSSCRVVKSKSKAKCPEPATPGTQTTTTT